MLSQSKNFLISQEDKNNNMYTIINSGRGIPSIIHSLARSCSLAPTSNENLRSKSYSLIGRGIAKREGPLGPHALIENSSYTGGYDFLNY
jgi:hypothetical protein